MKIKKLKDDWILIEAAILLGSSACQLVTQGWYPQWGLIRIHCQKLNRIQEILGATNEQWFLTCDKWNFGEALFLEHPDCICTKRRHNNESNCYPSLFSHMNQTFVGR